MIVGTGMMARAFSAYKNHPEIVIFASGVANSRETNPAEFAREENLLLQTIRDNKEKILVYFSTCSIEDPTRKSSDYIIHKKRIESIIATLMPHYYIFRLPIVVGVTTNTTIINYLYQKVKNEECFDLWVHAKRNVIDVIDVFKIIDYILQNKIYENTIVSVASYQNTAIKAIVEIIETILNKKAKYTEFEQGAAYEIDISLVEPIIKQLQLLFDENYVKSTIEKYFLF